MQCSRKHTNSDVTNTSPGALLYQMKPVSPLVNAMTTLMGVLLTAQTGALQLHVLGWAYIANFQLA